MIFSTCCHGQPVEDSEATIEGQTIGICDCCLDWTTFETEDEEAA